MMTSNAACVTALNAPVLDEPSSLPPLEVFVSLDDARSTVEAFAPLRDGDVIVQLRRVHRIWIEGEDGYETMLITSLNQAGLIHVPDALHTAMQSHIADLGWSRLDSIDAVIEPFARALRMDWATVTHKLIGFANSDGEVRYLRTAKPIADGLGANPVPAYLHVADVGADAEAFVESIERLDQSNLWPFSSTDIDIAVGQWSEVERARIVVDRGTLIMKDDGGASIMGMLSVRTGSCDRIERLVTITVADLTNRLSPPLIEFRD